MDMRFISRLASSRVRWDLYPYCGGIYAPYCMSFWHILPTVESVIHGQYGNPGNPGNDIHFLVIPQERTVPITQRRSGDKSREQ